MTKDFICEPDYPVVGTTAGKVRGFFSKGLFYFRGIPYAQSARFEMPVPPDPWDGIRNALSYGPICPPSVRPAIEEYDIIQGFRYRPSDEHCQTLNIWTQDINNGKKKPVMFWIHGGAYSWGSTIELEFYEAEKLCKKGDVVVVTFNHRLNIFGFMDLRRYREKYRYSGTSGVADMVAALDWVRENIADFGGDPNNITIFGQSGGGGKVQAMMQTPAAAGKFKRAIIQSGCVRGGMSITAEESMRITDAVVAELGLTRETIDEIQTMPYERIFEAYYNIAPSIIGRDPASAFGPVANGYFLGEVEDIGFTDFAKTVPVIVGSCIGEFGTGYLGKLSTGTPEEELLELVRGRLKEHADEAVALYRTAYPGKSLLGLFLYDTFFRPGTLDFLDARIKTCSAPTYTYMLTYDFKILGGFPAWHASDLPLMFHSADRVPAFNEAGAEKLADEMTAAWAAFAHNGDPKTELLPEWPCYSIGERSILLFDDPCRVVSDHDRKLVDILVAAESSDD